jgi:putative flippase GtrA
MNKLFGQAVRFGMVGVINTLAGLSVIYGLMFFTATSAEMANAAGYGVGFTISFSLNKKWTFGHAGKSRDAFLRYAGLAAACYFVNLGVLMMCIHEWGVNRYIGQIFGAASYTTCMFVGSRAFVFPASASVSPSRRGA